MNELITSLCKARLNFKSLSKSKNVKVKTKQGYEYSYNYCPLEDILDAVSEALAKEGLTIVQRVIHDGESPPTLHTELWHSSGQHLPGGSYALPNTTDPKEMGSAITYARRYALTSVLSLSADDDDDGTTAQHNAAPRPQGKRNSNGSSNGSSNGNGYDKSQDKRPISEPQIKRMKTISSKHGWTDDPEAGKALMKEFGFESSKDVTRDCYEPICNWLERGPEAFRKAHNMNPALDIPGLDADEDDGSGFEVQESLGELSYPHGYGTPD